MAEARSRAPIFTGKARGELRLVREEVEELQGEEAADAARQPRAQAASPQPPLAWERDQLLLLAGAILLVAAIGVAAGVAAAALAGAAAAVAGAALLRAERGGRARRASALASEAAAHAARREVRAQRRTALEARARKLELLLGEEEGSSTRTLYHAARNDAGEEP